MCCDSPAQPIQGKQQHDAVVVGRNSNSTLINALSLLQVQLLHPVKVADADTRPLLIFLPGTQRRVMKQASHVTNTLCQLAGCCDLLAGWRDNSNHWLMVALVYQLLMPERRY